jgi:hypothetical protein
MVVSSLMTRASQDAVPVAAATDSGRTALPDPVERALIGSFPASDPPAWLIVSTGRPRRAPASTEAEPWAR